MNLVGIKELKQNTAHYAELVRKGQSFIVVKKTKPLFKLAPLDSTEDGWEEVVDFTKLHRGGIKIKELIARLWDIGRPVGMDKITKAVKKLTAKERQVVKRILTQLANSNTTGLDIKKLVARDDIFRVRKGDIRIIYRHTSGSVFILAIERRSESTYRQ